MSGRLQRRLRYQVYPPAELRRRHQDAIIQVSVSGPALLRVGPCAGRAGGMGSSIAADANHQSHRLSGDAPTGSAQLPCKLIEVALDDSSEHLQFC